MIARTVRGLAILVMLSVFVAGCGFLNISSSDTRLNATVVLADTELPLASTVTFGSTSLVTESGSFTIDIPSGVNAYSVATLLGEHTGEINHDGKTRKTIRFPAFTGWSARLFDAFITDWGHAGSARWPRYEEIPVWVAGPVVRFAPESEVENKAKSRGTIGLCTFWYSPTDSRLVRGEIYAAYSHQESLALLLHEIGHCIGLAHSTDDNDVMYPILHDDNRALTEQEQKYAQLLYSIPKGTQPLGWSRRATLGADIRAVPDDDGLIKITIPVVAQD